MVSLSLSWVTAVLLFTASSSAAAHQPSHKHPHRAVQLAKRSEPEPSTSAAPLSVAKKGYKNVAKKGYKNVAYYVNWALYARNYLPADVPADRVTHLLYAFANVDNKTGEVLLTDPFADVQKKFDGDDTTDNSTDNLYGALKQIYLLKKKNRNLKSLLSIGGWTYRENFALALDNVEGRKNFAKTSVQIMKDHGFDGVDIDWEYPNTTEQAQYLVDTCKEVRAELDHYSRNVTGNPHFLLTLAVPAGPDKFVYFNMADLTETVDFINLMAYDYAGTFSDFSGHQANFYKDHKNHRATNFSTDEALAYYLDEQTGWSSHNLNLGMPLYGRAFANTTAPGQPFSNVTGGSWENGAWDYKALAGNATFGEVFVDDNILASYSFNASNGYMVSYDTPETALKKAKLGSEYQLGGSMWWELSGDAAFNGTQSLVKTVTDYYIGCGGLEESWNVLDYPTSKWKNLRDGMN